MNSLSYSINHIARCLENNDLDGADKHCRDALGQHKDSNVLIKYMGLIAYRKSDYSLAIDYLTRDGVDGHLTIDEYSILVQCCLRTDNFNTAIPAAQNAAKYYPSDTRAYFLLGIAHASDGNIDEGIKFFKKALLHDNRNASALINLGKAHLQLGQADKAVDPLLLALKQEPGSVTARFQLGIAYQQLDEFNKAVSCYETILEKHPEHDGCRKNLAVLQNEIGNQASSRLDLYTAEKAYRRATELMPENASIHNNLGLVLWRLGRIKETRQSYEKALQLSGENILWELRKDILCPSVYRNNDEIMQYRSSLEISLERFIDTGLKEDPVKMAQTSLYPPYALMYLYQDTDMRPIKESFARVFQQCFEPGYLPARNSRIKIGFVVSNNHEPVFMRLMWGVIKYMNKSEFEPAIICSRFGKEVIRSMIPADNPPLFVVPDRIDHMAEAIKKGSFDILYHWEISTDPVNYYLPFYGLAPVQCTGLGVPATSGIPAVDYYFTSEFADTNSANAHYSETLVRANSLLVFLDRVPPPTTGKTKQSFGFDDSQHVYLCLQQRGKIHMDFDPVIREILRRDKKGVVILTRGLFEHEGNVLMERFSRTLPDVIDRIVLMPRMKESDYFSLINIGDVLLDPLYYGGGITTYDGLSLNKPVITLPTTFLRGRQTAATYKKMGFTECIATSKENYIDLAVNIATNRDYNKFITGRIDETCTRLFRDQDCILDYENIFRRICQDNSSDNASH